MAMNMKLVIVEDNPQIRQMLKTIRSKVELKTNIPNHPGKEH